MNEVPLIPVEVTVFLTIWAAVGPLVGILIGHYLLRSWQRKQWFADNRLREWRELIGTLFTSFSTISLLGNKRENLTAESVQEHYDADTIALLTINNRIYIDKEVEQEKIHARWNSLVSSFEQSKDGAELGKAFGALSKTLKRMAYEDVKNI